MQRLRFHLDSKRKIWWFLLDFYLIPFHFAIVDNKFSKTKQLIELIVSDSIEIKCLCLTWMQPLTVDFYIW